MKLKRSFPYYLYHVYIPGALLVVLSFTTFFIPPSAVPARVTLIVTNFLSTMFIFGSTSSLIPKEPYITAMEIYSLINIVFIILVMAEYILVLKLKALKNKKLAVSYVRFVYKQLDYRFYTVRLILVRTCVYESRVYWN